MDVWKELKEVGHIPMRRAVTFAAGLALNQNAPHVAFEMISGVQQQNYVSVRNLKVCVTFMYSALVVSRIKIYLKFSDSPEPSLCTTVLYQQHIYTMQMADFVLPFFSKTCSF
jgi:hypothetical protein